MRTFASSVLCGLTCLFVAACGAPVDTTNGSGDLDISFDIASKLDAKDGGSKDGGSKDGFGNELIGIDVGPEDTLTDGDGAGPSDVMLDGGDDGGDDSATAGDAGGADLAGETSSGGCAFPANPAAGEPGAPCTGADDCDSAFCVDSANGKICSQACVSCCPAGFACDKMPGVDGAYACLPKALALCQPCQSDAACGKGDPGALCLSYGDAGRFCGAGCTNDGDCPAGYACQVAEGTLGVAKQCVLGAGTCACSQWGALVGASTACSQSNSWGTCSGTRKCGLAGLTACSAPAPATETCNGVDDNCDGVTDPAGAVGCVTYFQDGDGDGFGTSSVCTCSDPGASASVGGDCDDGKVGVHPGAKELCDGLDNDCDGLTDPGFADSNLDGFADCVDPDIDGDGVANAQDCAPANVAAYPGAQESCDGIDNNCDGQTDEVGAQGCSAWFADGDGDGVGAGASLCLCAKSPGYGASVGGDCDDGNPAIRPGVAEICNDADDNCNGQSDEGCDDDLDLWCDATMTVSGSPAVCPAGKQDCDDKSASVHPGQADVCGNSTDDNCDGLTDSGDSVSGCAQFFVDNDGDGYGDKSQGQCLCAATALYAVKTAGDCDDGNPAISPKASEVCNGKDDDCDGSTDVAASDCKTYYADGDGDGAGVSSDSKCLCAAAGLYSASAGGDCNDAATAVRPGAAEVCNGIDDNCDGVTDPANTEDCSAFWKDADLDGWGSYLSASKCLCAAIPGYVDAGGDCDDGNTAIHPQATEVCNGKDDDCDGSTDPLNAVNCATFHLDADGDTYGVVFGQCACAPQGLYTALSADDCDDTQSAIHPQAAETCNGLDDDCNGQTDEGLQGTYYADIDGDGYGTGAGKSQCAPTQAYSAVLGGDCNDQDLNVHPLAKELCNGVDDDCNGQTDENAQPTTWYQDNDKDAYGSAVSQIACSQPAGYVLQGGDCNDASASIHPGVTEVCNSLDDNCSGQTDEGLSCLACASAGAPLNGLDKSGSASLTNSNGDGGWIWDTSGEWTATQGSSKQYLRWGDVGYYPGCGYWATPGDTAAWTVAVPANATFVAIDYSVDNKYDTGIADQGIYVRLTFDGQTQQVGPFQTLQGAAWHTIAWPVSAQQKGKTLSMSALVVAPTTTYTCDSVGVALDNVRAITDCTDPAQFCSPASVNGGQTPVVGYPDQDNDGFGSGSGGGGVCILTPGLIPQGGDCNDQNAAIHNGAPEVCDGLDNDCNGGTDDLSGVVVNSLDSYADIKTQPGSWWSGETYAYTQGTAAFWWGSSDGCGYHVNDDTATFAVTVPSGASALALDVFFDNRHSINPDTADTTAWMLVTINGVSRRIGPFSTVQTPKWRTLVFPMTAADFGKTYTVSARVAVTVKNTMDGKGCTGGSAGGFAVDNVRSIVTCNAGSGGCSNGVTASTWFRDADGDGYGTAADTLSACIEPPGYVPTGGDCDDQNGAANPGVAKDTCATAGVDDNCDGVTDVANSTGCSTYYTDADGDGAGASTASAQCLCAGGAGLATNKTDCNDQNSAIKPGATETCNGVDDNCDGSTDPKDTSGCQAYFADTDKDGFGSGASQCWCSAQTAFPTLVSGDCNDNNASIHPGAAEACNSLDDNCDTQVDEGLPLGTWYKDADGDGHANPAGPTYTGCNLAGYVTVTAADDCDDTKASVYPGAAEACNFADDNCNAQIDEGLALGAWFQDGDGDGYGDTATQIVNTCQPSGYVAQGGDCNDAVQAIHPGAAETCFDSIDNNCSGATDEGCPVCAGALISGLNSASNWSNVSGNWGAKSAFTPTEGSYCATFGGTAGYVATTSDDVLQVTFNVPYPSPFLVVDYDIYNRFGTSTPDQTLQLALTFNGQTQTFGPYATIQANSWHQAKFAVPPELWGTQQTLVATPYAAKTNGYLLSGIAIDNIRSTCQ